ncbi:MAG: hypothetical protein P8X94_05180 [Woeseiaceae bacterium]
MSYIETVSPEDAASDVRAMYERQQRHWGYVPNYAKSFSHRPEAIAANEDLTYLSDAEREMLRFSRLVARDAAPITAVDVQRLRDCGLDDAAVFDVAATAAGRTFFTKILDAVGSMPDASLGRIDPDLRTALTVGHPVSTHPELVIDGLSD